jgi:hypothetical protein
VSSHKTLEKAKKNSSLLKSAGLEPLIRHESVRNKGMWYRIYIGRFETVADATKFAEDLKQKGIITGFWVKRIKMPIDEEKAITEQKAPIKEPEATSETALEKPSVDVGTDQKPTDVIPPPEIQPIPSIAIKAPERETPDTIEALSAQENQKTLTEDESAEAGAVSSAGIADNKLKINKLSLGFTTGLRLAPKAENFSIKRDVGTDSQTWTFQDKLLFGALTADYRLNSMFLVEGAVEKAFFSSLDLWHLSLGPKVEFKKIGRLTPHLKASLVLGHLEWYNVPGDFDWGRGWETGLGLSLLESNVHIGVEASYRAIRYDYNRPSEAGVTATDSRLDYSGISVAGTVSYWF